MTDNNIIHEAISALKLLAETDQTSYFKRGEMLHLLRESKVWHNNPPEVKKSWRKFLIHSGIADLFGKKPLTLELNERVALKLSPFVQKEGLQVIPSRCESLLPLYSDIGAYCEAVKECAQTHIPAIVFKDKLNATKGNKAKPECNHINCKREYWIKHSCGSWMQDPVK